MKRTVWGLFVIVILSTGAIAQSTETVFERGIRLANSAQFESALADFRETIESSKTERMSDAKRSRMHFNAGACLYRLGRFVEAESEFRRSIRLDPTYEKAFYSLGMTEAELRNWESAAEAFEAALRINKRNGETWFDAAYIYLALEQWPRAESAFRNAIKFGSKELAISHNNVGVLLAMGGKTDAAVAEFETALEISEGKLAVAVDNLRFCRSSAAQVTRFAKGDGFVDSK